MILLAFGTRPEYIKIRPLMNELRRLRVPYYTLFTGQHTDLLKGLEFDFNIDLTNYSNNRLNNIMASVINIDLEHIKLLTNIKYVLVQGDTSTALGIALNAFNHRIQIIHLEAGLRSYDVNNPYPEEMNRVLLSKLTNIHLCATENNADNLRREGIHNNIYVVGNTVLDGLDRFKGKQEYTDKVLITMHRRENHDIIPDWFSVFKRLSYEYPELEFILPIHPNPNVQKYKDLLGEKIKIVDPMSREELLDTLVKTKLVITDSGGLQEECSFFNKKCLVCRETTERPESLSMSSFLVKKPKDLYDMFYKHINTYEIDMESPFGDGKASEKIVNTLLKIN